MFTVWDRAVVAFGSLLLVPVLLLDTHLRSGCESLKGHFIP
jgi:hypothetical protein